MTTSSQNGDKIWLAFTIWADPPASDASCRSRKVRYTCSSQFELFDHLMRCRHRGPRLRTVMLMVKWQGRSRGHYLWRRAGLSGGSAWVREAGDWLDPDWVDWVSGLIWAAALERVEAGQAEYLTRPAPGVAVRHCLGGGEVRLKAPPRRAALAEQGKEVSK